MKPHHKNCRKKEKGIEEIKLVKRNKTIQVIGRKYGKVTICMYIYIYLKSTRRKKKKIRFNEDIFIFNKSDKWPHIPEPVRHNGNNQIKVGWLHVTFSVSKFK